MDLITVFTVFIGLSFLYFSWRKASHRYLETKFKYKIYKLRDDLRELAIDEKIDCESFGFRYFDNALSRVACDSYYISIPFMAFTRLKNRKAQREIDELHEKLNLECSINPALGEIRDELTEAIWDYVQDQHKYSFLHVAVVIFDKVEQLKVGLANIIRRRIYNPKVVDNIIYYPVGNLSSRPSYTLVA